MNSFELKNHIAFSFFYKKYNEPICLDFTHVLMNPKSFSGILKNYRFT